MLAAREKCGCGTKPQKLPRSAYLTGGDGLRGNAAIVDAPLGVGHVVMLGTDVTYRGQSTGDFMFLFNAMLMGGR